MTFLQKGCSGESPKRETGPSNNEAKLQGNQAEKPETRKRAS